MKNYIQLSPVNHDCNKRCTIEVFKCLSGLAPTAFEGYFRRNSYSGMNTRGINKHLVVPRIKTESGKKIFMFQGAKVLNKIITKIQDNQSLLCLKSECKDVDLDC